MASPLHAHTLNEVRYFLLVTPCPSCGKGPWEIDAMEIPRAAGPRRTVRTHCRKCRHGESFEICCEDAPADKEAINQTDEPSRIVDLHQWLALFYMLLEKASDTTAAAARLYGYRAALCLAEALKFYPDDDELPPGRAFFTDAGRTAFREHPEKFARQKLRDMQARLPALPRMAGRVGKDLHPPTRKWWEFWKRQP